MSIISTGGSPNKTTPPAVAYSNIFESGTVTASSEATGYFKENAYDWRGDDILLFDSGTTHTLTVDYGSAVSVDVFCLAYHNLGTLGATVTIRYSTDNFAADDNVLVTLSPSDDRVIFKPMTSTLKRYWRIQIALGAAGQPYIGQALLGEMLELSHGPVDGDESVYDSHMDEIINNTAQNGNFLGRSVIYQGVEGAIPFRFMQSTYLRGDYRAFITHARNKPFFYSWRPTLYDEEAVICWTKGRVPTPKATNTLYYETVIPIEGRKS